MKKIFSFVSVLCVLLATLACGLNPLAAQPPASPTAALLPATSLPTAVPAATTPEIFIARTQAVPAQMQLNGVTLAVQSASFSTCDLPECPAAPAGKRYLRVNLQAVDLPAGQSLDYKNLPQGIAIYDDTRTVTPFSHFYIYAPTTQQLSLYFAVPEAASKFGLQWPGFAEIPLEVTFATLPTVQPTVNTGTSITYSPLSFVLPQAVASGASGSDLPRVDSPDASWWMKTPGHLQVSFDGYYTLQGKFHQPQIAVFPALEYAQLVPAAFESIHRIDNLLYDPSTASSLENLPAVPFFNDLPMFGSNIEMITFQNGSGVRFITQTAQGPTPVNNQDVFYHFEGLSSDGTYYIVAVLPVTISLLAETNDPGAPLPPGGIPYPGVGKPGQAYIAAVTELLNAAPEQAFTPNLDQLDALIQSMYLAP